MKKFTCWLIMFLLLMGNTMVLANTQAAIGSRENPYSSDNTATIPMQRYKRYVVKNINLTVETVITGKEANDIINTENRYNKKPTNEQEWRIYIFNLKYVSSANDEVLKANEIINKRYFFSKQGQSMVIHDTAALGNKYNAYRVNSISLYPGGNSKVVFAVLTDKDEAIPMIQIPYEGGNKNNWVSCEVKNNNSSVNMASFSQSNHDMYKEFPTVPNFGSFTGLNIKEETWTLDNKSVAFGYELKDVTASMITGYMDILVENGFKPYNEFDIDALVFLKDNITVTLRMERTLSLYDIIIITVN